MSAIGNLVGQEAQDGAGGSSTGKCLRFVGNAVQRALGQTETATGYNSAKDSAPFFQDRGFSNISTSSYQNGDIVIMEGSAKHPHGHIQVYNNGRWYSDFSQNSFYPYADGSKPDFQVYRYDE